MDCVRVDFSISTAGRRPVRSCRNSDASRLAHKTKRLIRHPIGSRNNPFQTDPGGHFPFAARLNESLLQRRCVYRTRARTFRNGPYPLTPSPLALSPTERPNHVPKRSTGRRLRLCLSLKMIGISPISRADTVGGAFAVLLDRHPYPGHQHALQTHHPSPTCRDARRGRATVRRRHIESVVQSGEFRKARSIPGASREQG